MVITRKAKAQTVPSTRVRMAMSTRILAAVGNKPSRSQITIKSPARAGDSRIRAAGPRRSGEATMVGNPDRIALVARGVAEVAEVGVMVAVVSVADRNL